MYFTDCIIFCIVESLNTLKLICKKRFEIVKPISKITLHLSSNSQKYLHLNSYLLFPIILTKCMLDEFCSAGYLEGCIVSSHLIQNKRQKCTNHTCITFSFQEYPFNTISICTFKWLESRSSRLINNLCTF